MTRPMIIGLAVTLLQQLRGVTARLAGLPGHLDSLMRGRGLLLMQLRQVDRIPLGVNRMAGADILRV